FWKPPAAVHFDPRHKDDFLQVLNVGDWKPVYSGRFPSMVTQASFFADSEGLYAETQAVMEDHRLQSERSVVDLRNGQRSDRITADDVYITLKYFAIATGRLLLLERGKPIRGRAGDLVILSLPDYSEVMRAPFATRERESSGPTVDGLGIESFLFFSADRETLAYAFDHTIVCRKTQDLRVLWTRQFEAAYDGSRHLAVSAK